MTPKEKADQLYNRVWYAGNYNDDNISHVCAINIAMILVDEICKEFYPVRYWDQVKSELEKLKSEFA